MGRPGRVDSPVTPGPLNVAWLVNAQDCQWALDDSDMPGRDMSAGKLLRSTLPYLFRSYRQHLGLESIRLPDAVALCCVLHPELFRTDELPGDVETAGDLTTGTTVFDRRPVGSHKAGMEVAMEVDAAAVTDCVVRGLMEAGRQT